MYYNTITKKVRKALPDVVRTDAGFIAKPKPEHLTDAGWLLDEVVSFTPPAGHQKIPGSYRIEVIENVPYEKWDVETDAEAEARLDAQESASKDLESDINDWSRKDKAFAKLVLDEINTLRARAGLPARTIPQLISAIRNNMDT